MIPDKNLNLLVGIDHLNRKFKTGLDRYNFELLNVYSNYLNKISIYSCDVYPGKIKPNIYSFSLNISRKKYFLKELLNISFTNLSIIKKIDPDIIHLFLPIPLRKQKKPVIVTIHDLTPFITPFAFPKYTQFITRQTILQHKKNGVHFVTNSFQTKTDLVKYFKIKEERITTIHLGINTSFKPFNNEEKYDSIKRKYNLPAKYFIFLGAMNKRKNLNNVISAFKIFSEKFKEIKLVLAGRMEAGGDDMTKYTIEQGLEKEIVFPGYIDENDLNAVISNSMAMIYMSLYEGFGFPVLEAMACGTTVLASNVSSIPEIAGNNIFFANPLSISEIASGMEKIISDNDVRAHKIKTGLEWVKQFTWEQTAKQTLDLYTQLL